MIDWLLLLAALLAAGGAAIIVLSVYDKAPLAGPTVAAIALAASAPVALITYQYKLSLDRASFAKDYMATFFDNPELTTGFNNLVYSYTNDEWSKVRKAYDSVTPPITRPLFLPETDRATRNLSRLYHPNFFQGSPEEGQIDRVLGFFNTIGLYYSRGLISLGDVGAVLGFEVSVLHKRDVIKCYMLLLHDARDNPASFGLKSHFPYLKRLIFDFNAYKKFVNTHHEAIEKPYIDHLLSERDRVLGKEP